jgi:hypothetical protein
MTLGTLILAIAATIVGSLFTLFTSTRLTREAGRTAARLIYAELTRNSAPVSYYIDAWTWPQARFDSPAWDKYSEAIAKRHKADAFNTICKGYAALEAIAFIAQEGGQLGEDRGPMLTEEVKHLCQAIRKAGQIAKVHDEESERWLTWLEHSGNRATPAAVTGSTRSAAPRHSFRQTCSFTSGRPAPSPSGGPPRRRSICRSRASLPHQHQTKAQGEPNGSLPNRCCVLSTTPTADKT